METRCFGRRIVLEEGFEDLGAFVGLVCFSVIRRPGSGYVNAFLEELERVETSLRSRFKSLEELKENPVVRAYRSFYWRIGVDPTKVRPSGEALARRVLGGRGLKPIDPIVDAGNLASAETLVPIGLYDTDRVPGDLLFTLSKGDEEFLPIGGGTEKLNAGLPLLYSEGIVMHLYPHRDSRLTAISPSTTKVVGVSAGVPGVEKTLVLEALGKLLRNLSSLGVEHEVALEPTIMG